MSIYLPDANSSLEEFEPFLSIDFIITDIDGTVVSGKEPVIQQIKRRIRQLQKKRINVSIATGRTFRGAYDIIQDLAIRQGMPIALYNGGIVLSNKTDRILHSNSFLCNELVPIINMLQDYGTNIFFYTCNVNRSAFRIDNSPVILEEVFFIGNKKAYVDINNMIVKQVKIEEIMQKQVISSLIEKEGLNKNVIHLIEDYIDNNETLDYTDSGNGYIEIRARNANKGILIDIIRKQNTFPANNILAIGDNDNDRELFANADISIAVGNSSLSAITNADFVCNNNSAEGFLDILTTILNAHRYLGG